MTPAPPRPFPDCYTRTVPETCRNDESQSGTCLDCSVCTYFCCGGEYYTVSNDLWDELVGDTDAGMLCIGCLETRLGRALVSADFSDALLNQQDVPWAGERSPLLASRLLSVA